MGWCQTYRLAQWCPRGLERRAIACLAAQALLRQLRKMIYDGSKTMVAASTPNGVTCMANGSAPRVMRGKEYGFLQSTTGWGRLLRRPEGAPGKCNQSSKGANRISWQAAQGEIPSPKRASLTIYGTSGGVPRKGNFASTCHAKCPRSGFTTPLT